MGFRRTIEKATEYVGLSDVPEPILLDETKWWTELESQRMEDGFLWYRLPLPGGDDKVIREDEMKIFLYGDQAEVVETKISEVKTEATKYEAEISKIKRYIEKRETDAKKYDFEIAGKRDRIEYLQNELTALVQNDQAYPGDTKYVLMESALEAAQSDLDDTLSKVQSGDYYIADWSAELDGPVKKGQNLYFIQKAHQDTLDDLDSDLTHWEAQLDYNNAARDIWIDVYNERGVIK